MKTEAGINYQSLPFTIQRELDQKAYSKYYDENYDTDLEILSFNSWYGTKYHEKYLNFFLRKYKLQKLNEISR